MKTILESIVRLAQEKEASDIHFVCRDGTMEISLRIRDTMEILEQDIFDQSLFAYLKYYAGLDLTNPGRPQSGKCELLGIPCRFSVIRNPGMETGVLRLLPSAAGFPVSALSRDKKVVRFLLSVCAADHGLFLFAGPTGSGKTTTQHAILRHASLVEKKACVSLEDPVEIPDPSYLQLEVNEKTGFTFETGIVEVLRHDPDIICIGETRSAYVCRKLFTAALTGHVAMSTIHAGTARDCILRLLDLGIPKDQVKQSVSAIICQKMSKGADGRKECLYEIVEKDQLDRIVDTLA